MNEKLFTDLAEASEDAEPDICIPTVEAVIVLVAEAYYSVFSKQATRFYIGDDAIVPKKLAEDPTFWDYVPNNAMMIEHFVEAERQAEKRSNKGASVKTISNQLVVGHGAYLRQLKKREVSDKQSEKDLHWAKNDPQAKLVRSMEGVASRNLADDKKDVLAAKQNDEIQAQVKRQKLVADLAADHNGPITSQGQLTQVCEDYGTDEERLRRILELEIRYQKNVIGVNPRLKSHYRIQYLLPSNKVQKYPSTVLKDNILEIISPRSGAAVPTPRSITEIEEGAEIIRQKLRNYNPARREANAGYVAGDFVFCYWTPESNNLTAESCLWFGRILEVHQTDACSICQGLEFNGDEGSTAAITNYCFTINYFVLKRGTALTYSQISNTPSEREPQSEYHTMGWQVLRKVRTSVQTKEGSPVVYRVPRKDRDSSLSDINKLH